MRIIISGNIVIVCDWAKRVNNRIVLGTRTKEIICVKYDSEAIAKIGMDNLIKNNQLSVEAIHQMPYASLGSVLDLVSGRTTW